MCDIQTAVSVIGGRKMECNSQTVRYVVAVAALTVLGTVAIIVDGDIGNTIAVAVAAGIGYMIKDWRTARAAPVEVVEDAEEVPQ